MLRFGNFKRPFSCIDPSFIGIFICSVSNFKEKRRKIRFLTFKLELLEFRTQKLQLRTRTKNPHQNSCSSLRSLAWYVVQAHTICQSPPASSSRPETNMNNSNNSSSRSFSTINEIPRSSAMDLAQHEMIAPKTGSNSSQHHQSIKDVQDEHFNHNQTYGDTESPSSWDTKKTGNMTSWYSSWRSQDLLQASIASTDSADTTTRTSSIDNVKKQESSNVKEGKSPRIDERDMLSPLLPSASYFDELENHPDERKRQAFATKRRIHAQEHSIYAIYDAILSEVEDGDAEEVVQHHQVPAPQDAAPINRAQAPTYRDILYILSLSLEFGQKRTE